ncbi:MAG TPA: hypothetical protein VH414_13515, partial [Lichenihabitans sp.]|nr:hypothetical protein [Lichenihabitans sp.]
MAGSAAPGAAAAFGKAVGRVATATADPPGGALTPAAVTEAAAAADEGLVGCGTLWTAEAAAAWARATRVAGSVAAL